MSWIVDTYQSLNPSDIDSAGGSDHAVYDWKRDKKTLYLRTAGYESQDMTETPVTLYGVTDFKVGTSGTGVFYFRKKNVPITWKLVSL